MTPDNKEILVRLAQQAVDVQYGVNLSGIVHSFSTTMTLLREVHKDEPNTGTDFFNTHPIAVLYASKIACMTGCENTSVFSKALSACMDIAGV